MMTSWLRIGILTSSLFSYRDFSRDDSYVFYNNFDEWIEFHIFHNYTDVDDHDREPYETVSLL